MTMEGNEPKTVGTDNTKANSDHTNADNDADKTGTDKNSDRTKIGNKEGLDEDDKFDKPKREIDPDTTEIDVDSDRTKEDTSKINQIKK